MLLYFFMNNIQFWENYKSSSYFIDEWSSIKFYNSLLHGCKYFEVWGFIEARLAYCQMDPWNKLQSNTNQNMAITIQDFFLASLC